MGLPWVRLDTQFAHNPKVVELVADGRRDALFVYVASIAYCGGQGTDGFIPKHSLFLIHGTPADAEALMEVGLWHMAPNGWRVNGWDEFQVSDEQARMRRERAQKGGIAKAQKAAAEKGLRSV